MKPSGKLTFSQSRHELENDLLQSVVQPEKNERGKCDVEVQRARRREWHKQKRRN